IRAMADRLFAGLPLRPSILPQCTGLSAAHPADHPAGNAGCHVTGCCAELGDDPRSNFADAGDDARRHHRTLPDCRRITALGGVGHGPAGAAAVPGDVPGRAVILALAEASGLSDGSRPTKKSQPTDWLFPTQAIALER